MAAGEEASQGVVVVTGAAGAIGAATVVAFLHRGFDVVGLDLDPSVEAGRSKAYVGLAVDVRDEQALADVLPAVARRGPLRHVVGVAGGALPEEPRTQDHPGQLSPEIFRSSVELNLISQFTVLHAVLDWIYDSGPADRSVIFTSSFNALSGQGMPAYSAAKAGLIGMMRALTAPLGEAGIRVNVVAPGTIRTPRTERIWGDDADHFSRLEETTALGRLGLPDDVAATFVSLATTLTHVTGQVVVVDGGQMTKRR